MSVVKSRKLWVGGYNLSGHLQAGAMEIREEGPDDTTWGDVSRSHANGLVDYSLQYEGVWSAGTGAPDNSFDANKGLANVLATYAHGSVEGAVAYLMRTTAGTYKPGGKIGELLRFSVSLKASGGIGAVRGTLMDLGVKSTTANGAKIELGAVGSGQSLYAGLHVVAVTGTNPTLDLVVQSDANGTAGGETTRITFAQMTTIGYQFATPVAGPFTDTFWRMGWTIGGTSSPSFDIAGVIGIK